MLLTHIVLPILYMYLGNSLNFINFIVNPVFQKIISHFFLCGMKPEMKTTSQINFLQQIKFTCMKRKKFFIQFSQLNIFFSFLLIERWEDENYIVLREVAFLKELRMCYTLCNQKNLSRVLGQAPFL
jgi:hypothetical protein